MPAGDVYRISIQGSGLGSTYMNVLALRQIGAVDLVQADFQAFADGFKDAFRPSQASAYTWRSWRATQVFGPNVDYTVEPCKRVGGFAFEANLTGTLVGADAQDTIPPQCAMVLTLGSGEIGRRKRGRIYMWGFSEQYSSGGQWATSILNTVTTAFTTWFNKYKAAGTDPKIQLGIWSDRTAFGCEWRGDPPSHQLVDSPKPDQAFTPATSFTLRSNINTQRRRAIGVGR